MSGAPAVRPDVEAGEFCAVRPRIMVLIPVYNHGATLRRVVEDALVMHPHVMVVDDGSTDGGPDTLDDLPVHLVRLGSNQGKGAAIRRGAAEARTLGCTHIITMDADAQHRSCDLPGFLTAIEETPCAIVIGARDFSVPNVPGSSRFGRKFSGFWMFVQTGVKVSDMQSGFRAYPLVVLERVRCSEMRYSFEIEIVVRSAWAGFEIREFPVTAVYPPRAERISHFHALADNVRISLLNTRLTIRALMPLPFERAALEVEGRLSLRHPVRTLCELIRRRGSPRELGVSAAWAVFLSTLPLPGLQTILVLLVVNWRRLNRLCALVMLPLTWPPFVPGLAVLLGYRVLRGEWLTQFSVQTLGVEAGSRLVDWVVGSLCLAPVLACLCGGLVYLGASVCERIIAAAGRMAGTDAHVVE